MATSRNVPPNDLSTNKNGGVVFSSFRPPGSPVRPFGAIFFYAVYGDRSYSSDISIDEMSLIGTRHMALTQGREAVRAAEGSAQPCMVGRPSTEPHRVARAQGSPLGRGVRELQANTAGSARFTTLTPPLCRRGVLAQKGPEGHLQVSLLPPLPARPASPPPKPSSPLGPASGGGRWSVEAIDFLTSPTSSSSAWCPST